MDKTFAHHNGKMHGFKFNASLAQISIKRVLI